MLLSINSSTVYAAELFDGACEQICGGVCPSIAPLNGECMATPGFGCVGGSHVECTCLCNFNPPNRCVNGDSVLRTNSYTCDSQCCGYIGGECQGNSCDVCGQFTCGDGMCNSPCESRYTCAEDCPGTATCGDGLTNYAFEDCDDGNTINGDGCGDVGYPAGGACRFEDGKIANANLQPSTGCQGVYCSVGNTLRASMTINGDVIINYVDAPLLPDYIYITAKSTDGTCQINFTSMNGIYRNVSTNGVSPFAICTDYEYPMSCPGPHRDLGYTPNVYPQTLTIDYTIPSLPANCVGKSLTTISAHILGHPNNLYSEAVPVFNKTITPIVLRNCGNGQIDSGEQCDGTNFNGQTCASRGFSTGNLLCQNSCTYINDSQCRYTVIDIDYSLGSGCNPYTNACGRNSVITVNVSHPGATVTSGITSNVKVKGQTAGGDCVLNPIITLTSNTSNSLSYNYIITPSVFQSGGCPYNPLINNTYDSKLLRNGATVSNVFQEVFPSGFKLSECGDGQIDYWPLYGINEQCDYNMTGQPRDWMTSSCAAINSTHPGGTATCNQNTCRWNMTSCYRCGDGVVNPGEQCDLGGNNSWDKRCSPECTWTFCGDSLPQQPNGLGTKGLFFIPAPGGGYSCNGGGCEQCDDGNVNSSDVCSNNCTNTYCGDGIVQWPNGRGQNGTNVTIVFTQWGYEQCEDNNLNNLDACLNDCRFSFCGDGFRQPTNHYGQVESCDNGTLNSPTGTCNSCQLTYCGDKIHQVQNGQGTGGRNNDGKEECDGESGCDANCVLKSCGDGNIDPGEECDVGLIPDDFCQACKLMGCDVTDLTITSTCEGNICTTGDVLTITGKVNNVNCDVANIVQVDYISDDESCKIERNPREPGMQGMTGSYVDGNNIDFEYSIPSIPDHCAGKIMMRVNSLMYTLDKSTGNYFQRSLNLYDGEVDPITLDQCSAIGEVLPYSLFGEPSEYNVIRAANNCYTHTCNNYDAQIVQMSSGSRPGVNLFNDVLGAYRFHMCGIEDNICPDDFDYNGACRNGINRGGICTSNSIVDPDCAAHTFMKCGVVLPLGGGGTALPIHTCIPPVPTPHKYCSNPTDCVYKSGTGDTSVTCNSINSTTIDNNHTIQCSLNNTWCPRFYTFNTTLGRCVNTIPQCSDNCEEILNVSKIVQRDLKNSPLWHSYLENDGCFITDRYTFRRKAYCGVGLNWPEVKYYFLPVGVVRYIYNPFTGEFDIVDGGSDVIIGDNGEVSVGGELGGGIVGGELGGDVGSPDVGDETVGGNEAIGGGVRGR
ncbi:MAG: hypothetical protein ACP5NV_00620 [Candidatus Woesearchaeota archaeon]